MTDGARQDGQGARQGRDRGGSGRGRGRRGRAAGRRPPVSAKLMISETGSWAGGPALACPSRLGISTRPSSRTLPACSLRSAVTMAALGTACVMLGRSRICSRLRMCLFTASRKSPSTLPGSSGRRKPQEVHVSCGEPPAGAGGVGVAAAPSRSSPQASSAASTPRRAAPSMAEERGAELGAAPERRREPVCRQRRSERSAARRGRWQPSWGAATAPRRGRAAAEGGGARGSGVCRRGGGGGRLHAQAPRAKLAAGGEQAWRARREPGSTGEGDGSR